MSKVVKGVGNAVAGGIKGLGGIFTSKPANTPQQQYGNEAGGILRQGMAGNDIISQLLKGFGQPAYGGSFGQQMSPEQQAAIGAGNQGLQQFLSGDQGASALAALSKFAGGSGPFAPPGMEDTLKNLPGGDVLGGIASGNSDIMQQLLGLTSGGAAPDAAAQLLGIGGNNQSPALALLQGFQPQTVPQGLQNIGAQPSAGEQGLLGLQPNIDISQVLSSLQNFGQGNVQQMLMGMAGSPGAAESALMGMQPNINVGNDLDMVRQFINGQNPYISQVANAGQIATPERQLLLQSAMRDPTRQAQGALGGAQDIIGQLMSTPALQNLLSGGGGIDAQSIFDTLNKARQGELGRGQRDIREQLGQSGLRFSTNLADIQGQQQTESLDRMMAQITSMMPQLAGQQQQGQLGALQTLLGASGSLQGLGQTIGQLGLGRQSNVLGGLGQAGQLGISGNKTLDALVAAMQGQQAQSQTGSQAAQAAAGTNLAAQQGGLDAILRQLTGAGQLEQGRMNPLAQLSQQLLGATQGAGELGLNSQQSQIQDLIQQMTGAGQLANTRAGAQANALGTFGQLGQGASGQSLQALQALLGGQQGDMAQRIAALTQGGQLGTQSQGQQANILQQILGQQQQAAGTQGQQALQGQDILSRLFGQQQGNALQAALAQPNAISQMAQLPMNLAQSAFNLNEGGRTIQDQMLSRQYQDFIRQQSLLPQILGLMGGGATQQPQMAPSPWNVGVGAATDILGLLGLGKKTQGLFG